MTTATEKQKSAPEFEFFVRSDLSEYKGQYVAIIGKEVVASGKTAKEVWGKAKRRYPNKTPTLAKLPKEEALVLIW